MPRATGVISAGHGHNNRAESRPVSDTVILDFAQRSAARGTVTTVNGIAVEVDLRGPVRLRTDDLLEIDDGSLIEVVAAPELLIEARASDLSRVAWHLGDRHIAVELLPNRIRVRRDVAVETLLTSLGAKLTMIEAPFEPEGGAYAAPAHTIDHSQKHDHRHTHGHTHDESCGHDHAHGHAHHQHD